MRTYIVEYRKRGSLWGSFACEVVAINEGDAIDKAMYYYGCPRDGEVAVAIEKNIHK